MDRRSFMRYGSAALASLAVGREAFAQSASHTMTMTASMPGMAMPAATAADALLPVSDLPVGSTLPALRILPNQATQAGLFKATLTARPVEVQFKSGLSTTAWAYNGQLPGPLIEVMEGDTLEIRLVNQLAQPTTVHWHGLPVPPDQDGNPGEEVPPGGERLYRFTLPLGTAGTYWYHPHPHGYTAEQAWMGLAGALIVRAKADPLAPLPEQHLLFSDLKLATDGRIAGNSEMDWMNGREGQFVLVNGAHQPVINVNGAQHWRLWNACNARYLRLSLAGRPFQLVGSDGGLLAQPRTVTELLLSPGERAQIVVSGAAGAVTLQATPYDRGKMGDVAIEQTLTLAKVLFDGAKAAPLPTRLRDIAPLTTPVARKEVRFSEQMSMDGGVHQMIPLINGKRFDMQRVDLSSQRNAVEAWSLVNDSDMDHPFHLHGTQFQVVSRSIEGKIVPEPFLAWRDTVNTRPGETVVIHTVQHQRGKRMFHCHILEHEDRGMMGMLEVI